MSLKKNVPLIDWFIIFGRAAFYLIALVIVSLLLMQVVGFIIGTVAGLVAPI